MRKLNIVIGTAFVIVFFLMLSSMKSVTVSPETSAADSVAEDRARYLKLVRASIKGNEKKAADSVFKNIKTMKGIPAGRLVAIMDIGYSRSLGVSCGHCHNTDKWESDEKPAKQVARDMSLMVKDVNGLIKGVKGLKSENPMVNCTTCHRGAIKPALDLEQK